MASFSYRKFYAEKKKIEGKIAYHYPEIKRATGIYMFYRITAYIGKSSEMDGILGRCASHCVSKQQHIDKSLAKRKLTCDGGQWHIKPLIYCSKSEVDSYEKQFIEKYGKTCELLNIESGGTDGKTLIAEKKEPKKYRDGLKQGRINTQKEIARLFEKHLDFTIKGKETKIKLKAKAKFEDFLKGKTKNEE